MTEEKLTAITTMYKDKVSGILETCAEGEIYNQLKTISDMLNTAEQHIKMFRLVGALAILNFAQGAFWILGIYTMKEMREHNGDT